MCNYCGCRNIEPIAQLTAEHEQISNLAGQIRRAVAAGHQVGAAQALRALHRILVVHGAVEELALYPPMARLPGLDTQVGTLFDEHDELDRVIDAALAATDDGDADNADWESVLTSLETLIEHIDHEEHGLFPAAAVSLDAEDWDRAAAIRADRQHESRPDVSQRD